MGFGKKGSHRLEAVGKRIQQTGKGTYILILYLPAGSLIRIGALGRYEFKKGYYAYVGSAFGPGGIAKRVGRHLCEQKNLHWHIDYLRQQAKIKEVWFCEQKEKLEHKFALILKELSATVVPAKGFGCSDCRCPTHLFYFHKKPLFKELEKIVCKDFRNNKLNRIVL